MGRQCRGGVGRERTANSKDTGSLPVVLYCIVCGQFPCAAQNGLKLLN